MGSLSGRRPTTGEVSAEPEVGWSVIMAVSQKERPMPAPLFEAVPASHSFSGRHHVSLQVVLLEPTPTLWEYA